MTTGRRRAVILLSLLIPAAVIGLVMWSAGVKPGRLASPDDVAVAARAPSAELQLRPPEQARTPAEPVQSAASTAQRLTLFATAPGRNSNEGTATVGSTADGAQTYAAGALLANRLRMVEIHRDFVVLEGNGVQQRLYLQSAVPAGAATEVAAGNGTAVANAQPTSISRPLRDALSEVVRSMSLYESDQLVGLELYAGARKQAFSQLGLEEGDVLVEIDGKPLTEAPAATQQLRAVLDGAALPVRIRRGGSLMTLTLDAAAVKEETVLPPTG